MAPPSDDEVQRILEMEGKAFIRMIQDANVPSLSKKQWDYAKSIHNRFLEIIACLTVLPGSFDVRVSTKSINVVVVIGPEEATQEQLECAVWEAMTSFAIAAGNTYETYRYVAYGVHAARLLLSALKIQGVEDAKVEELVENFLARTTYVDGVFRMGFPECDKLMFPVAFVRYLE
ncbi:uncharacterized protein PAC_19186 [Phialocephala subalpina]|uniref:Uncharacterized protein n=1 Tax=Phialocephala subalpina TaxID=576137 RepID=A0A1L7XW86_9HELO|nr:uncharacterized protein PAC_19186 [Phialocephala subalpina]